MDTLEEKKHIFKFLWWKDYQDLKDKISELETDLKDTTKKLDESIELNSNLNNELTALKKQQNTFDLEIELAKLKNQIEAKDNDISKLKKEKFEVKINYQNKMREVAGRNGGLTAQNNKLKNKIVDLEAQIGEFKSGKYKLLELPPDTIPKQTMSMKKGKARGGAKGELRKINRLREKEKIKNGTWKRK